MKHLPFPPFRSGPKAASRPSRQKQIPSRPPPARARGRTLIKRGSESQFHKSERILAAQALQSELQNILAGQPSYDLFGRRKPFHEQALGWHPDLNDGVSLNIRPFLKAPDFKPTQEKTKGSGLLRCKPNVKWTKDRGKEPQREKSDFPWFWSWDEETDNFQGGEEFDGNRYNDLHYSTATKQKARVAQQKETQS